MSQNTQYETYEDEIELKTLITTLWDFRLFILRVTALFGLLALVFSGASYFLTDPVTVYEAESVVRISVDGSAPRQKQAYLSVLSSQTSINEAINDVGISDGISLSDVSVSEVKDSDLIKITVRYPNASVVRLITDSIVNQSIMVSNDALNGVEVTYRELATLTGNNTTSKELPNIVLNVVIAVVLGGMISVFVVFFMEYLMSKIKTVEDIEKGLKVEVLTTLINTQPKKKQGWWPWKQ